MLTSSFALRTGDDTTGTSGSLSHLARKLSRYGSPIAPAPRLPYMALRAAECMAEAESANVFVANHAQLPQYPTGQETLAAVAGVFLSMVARLELGECSTGYGVLRSPLLTPVNLDLSEDLSETVDPNTVVVSVGNEVQPTDVYDRLEAGDETPEAWAARRIRALTELETDKIANLLGITRQAYYGWLSGKRPRAKHRDHLMQALSIVEEVARRRAGPRETAAWLVTPTGATNRAPADLIRAKDYDLCRSLLTKAARPKLTLQPRRPVDGPRLRETIDRLTSRAAPEDESESSEDE